MTHMTTAVATAAATMTLAACGIFAGAAPAASTDAAAGRAVAERANGDVRGAYASWCHGGTSRGTCTAIFRRHGRFLLVWATTQTSVNKYKVCVRSPNGHRGCRRLKTRRLSDETVGDAVWFSKYFPDNASGRYDVTWRVHGKQLGPELHFKQR